MKKILGILRGFPGLGRVVGGMTLLESLRDDFNIDIKVTTYLQGNQYLATRGFGELIDVSPLDYCSIGLLPTNQAGAHIHKIIKSYQPDMVIIDGEPLILMSLRISYPHLKIVALLNPSDVCNPTNEKESMDYFNYHYLMADLAIVHGTRRVMTSYPYKKLVSLGTIIRKEVLNLSNIPDKMIYCILGGGTVNVGDEFTENSLEVARLCCETAYYMLDYSWHIICSSSNIYDKLSSMKICNNTCIYEGILDSRKIYSNASLIITRSGRNTLSELAFLGIPSISFVTGCSYRKEEQKQNIINLTAKNIRFADIGIHPNEFAHLCVESINSACAQSNFLPGNNEAINEILLLLNS